MSLKITHNELKKKIGYMLLGIGTWFFVTPIREAMDKFCDGTPDWMIGAGLILLALYLFKMD